MTGIAAGTAAALVGRRVVVRRRLLSASGGHRFTDVLGRLESTGSELVVVGADGGRTTIAAADVHRIRGVPPGRSDVVALEEIAARGWPAPRTAWLGRWLLRAGDGWTGRANSVLPLGEPGMPVGEAIAAVRSWYAALDLPAQFAVPLPAAAQLDHQLAGAGFRARRETLVLTRELPAHRVDASPEPGPDPPTGLRPWTGLRLWTAEAPDERWLAAAYPGGLPSPVAQAILTGAERPIFAALLDGDTVAAHARAVIDGGWLGVTSLEVAGGLRRRGLATRLLAELHAWGLRNDAGTAYLQAVADNTGALALYGGLGYAVHHRYHYRLDDRGELGAR